MIIKTIINDKIKINDKIINCCKLNQICIHILTYNLYKNSVSTVNITALKKAQEKLHAN